MLLGSHFGLLLLPLDFSPLGFILLDFVSVSDSILLQCDRATLSIDVFYCSLSQSAECSTALWQYLLISASHGDITRTGLCALISIRYFAGLGHWKNCQTEEQTTWDRKWCHGFTRKKGSDPTPITHNCSLQCLSHVNIYWLCCTWSLEGPNCLLGLDLFITVMASGDSVLTLLQTQRSRSRIKLACSSCFLVGLQLPVRIPPHFIAFATPNQLCTCC